MGTVTALRPAMPATWSDAAERFLVTRDLSPTTRRVYRLTLEHVGARLPSSLLADLSPDALAAALARAYPGAAASSWNRHVATVRSFLSFTARHGWSDPSLAGSLERRRESPDHTRALTRTQIDALLARKDVPVRDLCLWRMLYETAARSQEVLRLNLDDLDLAQRRAVAIRKGGALDTIHWASGTARLLPSLVAGRTSGPLFLSARPIQARRAPALSDIDPSTGRARLSYARAAQIFAAATGGWTLHQLRHSALTHLADDGVPLPLLMAKSRHESLRTVQRYVHPSTEAVAALTARHDRAARHP